MTATKSDKRDRPGMANDSSIPRTTLKIPMPAGAKPPPPAPSSTKAAPVSHKSK